MEGACPLLLTPTKRKFQKHIINVLFLFILQVIIGIGAKPAVGPFERLGLNNSVGGIQVSMVQQRSFCCLHWNFQPCTYYGNIWACSYYYFCMKLACFTQSVWYSGILSRWHYPMSIIMFWLSLQFWKSWYFLFTSIIHALGTFESQVDGQFRTGIPGIFAIGDVAAFPLKVYFS